MPHYYKESRMGIKAGKVWGGTELIHANGVLEFHRINFNAGYTHTNLNGTDSLLNRARCLFEFGKMIKD